MSESKYARLRGLPEPSRRPISNPASTSSEPRTGPVHPIFIPATRRSNANAPASNSRAEEELPATKEKLPLFFEYPSNARIQKPFLSINLRMSKTGFMLLVLGCLIYLIYVEINLINHWMPKASSKSRKTNVILMVSDGYGPAGETFARSFAAAADGAKPGEPYAVPEPVALDGLLLGTHRSRSSSSLITDSAAGATAFACGVKSYNGAIGVDAEGNKCGTIFEAAKNQLGMLTGVVVTSRLTDATPAAFASHASSRALEADIATQEVLGTVKSRSKARSTDRILDLAIGGGGCNFMRKDHPLSCRADDIDLVEDAKALGWNVWAPWPLNITGPSQMVLSSMNSPHGVPEWSAADEYQKETAKILDYTPKSKSSTLPLLALLAPANTPFEIDRLAFDAESRPPSLKQLATRALDILDKDKTNDKGFLLMIEGSQIDLAAHANDGASHAREILAYQETIATVRKWVDAKNAAGERTILISTSDHETGGLTLGRQLTKAYPNYAWYPDRLLGAKQSAQVLSARLVTYAKEAERTPEELNEFIKTTTLGEYGAGFTPETSGEATAEEIALVRQCLDVEGSVSKRDDPPIDVRDVCRAQIAEVMSRRAEIGWSTSGHTGVDINVYGTGPGIDSLRGNIENTDIGAFIAKYLHLDLAKITKQLA